jgi:N-acetylmuramoyl-L-alanine amidase
MTRVISAMGAAVLAFASIGMIANAQAPQPANAIARAISVVDADGGVRVTVELTARVPSRAFLLEGAHPRFVLDLTGVRWQPVGLPAGTGAGAGAGLAEGLRYAEHATGVSRLVLDLAAAGVLASQREERLPEGGVALVFDVRPAREAQAPRQEAQPSPAQVRLASATSPARTAERPVIVIDAGHGGRDPGATGMSRVREKEVTLDAALRLRSILEDTGRYHVVLTRDADVFLPLPARLGLAREHGADLFISLHADAADNHDTQGASVYTISEGGAARGRRIATSQDWDMDLGDAPDDAQVQDILLDLAQRDTSNRSAYFAQDLIESLEPVTPLLRNTHRNAGFFVLLAPDVPAVLLEMGFLTNAEDERRLNDPRRRERMMRAVAAAIDAHFASNGSVMLAQH